MIVDSKPTKISHSRLNSVWYKHPTTDNQVMRVSRSINIGYHTELGMISRVNKIRNQFIQRLSKEQLAVVITFEDLGITYRSNNRTVKFTFTAQEYDRSWSEQRLQDLLDEIQSISYE